MVRSAATTSESSTEQNPGWMNLPWRIISTVNAGIATTDILSFTTPGKAQVLRSGQTTAEDWGTSCQPTSDGQGISGLLVSDNRSFLIQYDAASKRLSCTIMNPPPPSTAREVNGQGRPAPPVMTSNPWARTTASGTFVAEEGSAGLPGPHGPKGGLTRSNSTS
jgi:hypothetical protein